LRRASGVNFALYKKNTIQRRIKRRMVLHRMERLEDYLSFIDRKSTRLNSSHVAISYAVFCLKKKKRRNEILMAWLYPCGMYRMVAPYFLIGAMLSFLIGDDVYPSGFRDNSRTYEPSVYRQVM